MLERFECHYPIRVVTLSDTAPDVQTFGQDRVGVPIVPFFAANVTCPSCRCCLALVEFRAALMLARLMDSCSYTDCCDDHSSIHFAVNRV